jgi:hypothetical protein
MSFLLRTVYGLGSFKIMRLRHRLHNTDYRIVIINTISCITTLPYPINAFVLNFLRDYEKET